MINFLEVDYSDAEDKGAINVTLSASGDFNIDIKLTITPYTFQQYQDIFMRPLEPDVVNAAMGLDPAECECLSELEHPHIKPCITLYLYHTTPHSTGCLSHTTPHSAVLVCSENLVW